MKKIFIVVSALCFYLFIPTYLYSGILGDIDNDGKIGLNEAVNALQVTAGTRSAQSASYIITWKGTWAVNQNYQVYDAIQLNGSSYICIQNHTSDTSSRPPSANVWQPLALGPRTQPEVREVHCENGETIQGALGLGLIPGDEVLVSGTCNESVVMPGELNGITLNGQNRLAAITNGIDILGHGITLKGFKISGGSSAGVLVRRGGTATIDNNEIYNTGNNGISVNYSSYGTISNNDIHNIPNAGIKIGSNSSANIGNPGDSVVARANENRISSTVSTGITVETASSATIGYNTITDTGFGIYITDGSSSSIGNISSISNANIIKKIQFGVYVGRSSNARIIGNDISVSTASGVGAYGASYMEVKNNQIYSNNTGISVTGNSGANYSGNSGTNNSVGISCAGGGFISGSSNIGSGPVLGTGCQQF